MTFEYTIDLLLVFCHTLANLLFQILRQTLGNEQILLVATLLHLRLLISVKSYDACTLQRVSANVTITSRYWFAMPITDIMDSTGPLVYRFSPTPKHILLLLLFV